jgi:DNA-binding CsgD family transcriptional regulator
MQTSSTIEHRREVAGLTAREYEVLSWVCRGKTNPEIARILWISPCTVRKHLENTYAKFGVSTRTGAVATFLGWIDPDPVDASARSPDE